ncbi:carboxylesterase 1C-like [Ixodes scapularis]|uniref:carboxylesterase 1C-like n=1 Tax=Ixodes scapularis TaxID=6945 RepID=UPI001A9EABCF|nr:carboxylesterase 1C-like [Ixodes scapularis]
MGWKEIFTDVLYRCVMELMGKLFDQQGATVYFQEFWPKPSFVNSSGVYASHADDVYMLFGYPFLYPLLATDIERKTSLRMIGTLAAFAKDGKLPLLEDGSQWPEYSKAAGFAVIEHRHSGYSNTEPNRNCVAALSLNCDSKVSRLTPLF